MEDKEMQATKNLTFGLAINALKEGKSVARQGWNGKNMFIYLNRGSADYQSEDEFDNVEGISVNLFDRGDTGTVTRLPNLNMRTATGSTVTGWLASQTDLLAEDWGVV